MAVLPEERQTLMWSATWPKEVQCLANEVCLYNPVTIHVGEENLTINSNIEQIILCMNEGKKFDELCHILNEINNKSAKNKTLIFARTKRGCDQLCESLENIGYKAYSIHGDKSQVRRDTIIAQYKKGYKNILVATDVASRGLDIKDIGFVVNFDFPMTIEDYVHRIGRTGRAGATGSSYTFFTSNDNCFSPSLVNVLVKSGQKVPPILQEWLNDFKNKRSKGGQKNNYSFSRYNQGLYSNNTKPFKFNGNNNGFGQNSYGGGGGGGGFNNRGGGFNNRGGGFNQNNDMQNDFGGLSRGSLYKPQNNMMQNNMMPANNMMQNNMIQRNMGQPKNFNYQANHFGGDVQASGAEVIQNVQSKNPGLFAAQQNPVQQQPVQQNPVQYNNNAYDAQSYNQGYEGQSNTQPQYNYDNTYQESNTQQQNYYPQKDYNNTNNGYDTQSYNQSYEQQQPTGSNPPRNNNNRQQNYNADYNNNTNGNYNNNDGQYRQQDQRYNNTNNTDKQNKFDEQPRKFTNTKSQVKNSGLFAGDGGEGQQLNQIGKNQAENVYSNN